MGECAYAAVSDQLPRSANAMPNITDAANQRIRVGRRRHPKIRVIGHMKVPSATPLWSFARKRLSDQELTVPARKL
jgi:hypothetical protein